MDIWSNESVKFQPLNTTTTKQMAIFVTYILFCVLFRVMDSMIGEKKHHTHSLQLLDYSQDMNIDQDSELWCKWIP